MVIPVSLSPFLIAWWIGAPPRYFGSNEACTLIDLYFGALSNFMPTSCPYAAVTIKSGFNATISSYSFLIFSGWNTLILWASAHCLTGDATNSFFLPTHLSGWVTTPITSYFSIKASKIGTLNSGVPINTILNILSPLNIFRITINNYRYSCCLIFFIYFFINFTNIICAYFIIVHIYLFLKYQFILY